jgi:hypothetical protein
MEYEWTHIMEVEDSLQEAGIFRNGIRDTPCHSDSYMTLVCYRRLDQWMPAQTFPRDLLDYCIQYWSTNPNMQPPLRIVAASLKRFLEKNS